MKTVAVDWQENGSDYSDFDAQSDDESSSSHHHKKHSDYILGFEDGVMSRVCDQRDWNLSRLAGLPNNDLSNSTPTSNPFATGPFDCPDLFAWPDSKPTEEPSSTEPMTNPSLPSKAALTETTESNTSKQSEPRASPMIDKLTSQSTPTSDLPAPILKPYYLTTCYEARPAMNLSKDLDSLTISQGSSSRKVENKFNQAHSKRQTPVENDDGNGGWKGEKYERQTIEGVDQTFLTFQERVSWCGQSNQVIRYKVGGNPLPFSHVDSTPVYRCDTCGSVKSFEVQFMPVGVTLLNREISSGHGFTWSTMWVMTCSQDCHGRDDKDEEGWIEESVFLQWED
ncbi:programmed cell death protein 2 [Melampsora americana]|nr:programmed cell death protein 2 [Melampsora americana]